MRMSKLRTANLLGALAGEIAAQLDRQGKSHPNQTDSAAAALNVIGFYEGCSNGALSRALRLSHTATVRLVDKLEAAGLVTSEAGTDRRSVALRLTEQGRERARAIVQERCLMLADVINVLGPAQRAALDDIAETLLRALVTSAASADHICRLCDEAACPPEHCPVHQKASAMEAP
jgi:MarR family transcriptional regulator, negative regulator of the multidrug operon emrRAB